MLLLLVFGCTLVVAVLISERAERTVLSLSVLFLVVGAVLGEGSLGLLHLHPTDAIIKHLAEIALFTVLLTDGMKLSIREVLASSRLPLRALAVGLPITVAGTTLLARYIADLSWLESLLLGAILSPTDPVLVSSLVGRPKVPERLRHLLNIESGLNDGLALPVVLATMHWMSGSDAGLPSLASEVAAGVALGALLPWLVLRVEGSRWFAASERHAPLMPIAVGITLFALCSLVHANEYVAAFTAGITMATLAGDLTREFDRIGEPVSEVLKLAALLTFGSLVSWRFLTSVAPVAYLFAGLALVVVRPAALAISFVGAGMPRDQFAAAAWFGPKGFASVIYALLVVRTGSDPAHRIFELAAVVIAASIVAHSTTDVPVARWIIGRQERESRAEA